MSQPPVIYSVRVKRGPDKLHYDLHFGEDALRLRYLGEYWEHHRPLRGLQRSMDLLLYRINKRKNRARESTSEDIVIRYCDIRDYVLLRPLKRVKRRRYGNRMIVEEETRTPKLVITTREGVRLEIEFAPRVYELVKTLVKRKLEPGIARCKGESGEDS